MALSLSGCAGGTDFPSLSSILPFFPVEAPKLAKPELPSDTLNGADSTVVARALGQPELVRHEGTAEIWHYSGDHCRLLVFLYAEGSGAQVRHVDVWPQNQDPRFCMNSVTHRGAVVPVVMN